eukprot:CAMPEP_0113950596 /NCGR_PEP_ID=MMETSP1339-20121228/81627_1 /TAXON_ID=94617 /ORGANISM="Fibrocapsa japonica" /LENGTH=63 /DNA_ID=CAMNT_0000958481 /DNA_START=416 /DNA_END=604 /DNA_ORIENTATION=- /assembly_acc=CAM_ASM_000762
MAVVALLQALFITNVSLVAFSVDIKVGAMVGENVAFDVGVKVGAIVGESVGDDDTVGEIVGCN